MHSQVFQLRKHLLLLIKVLVIRCHKSDCYQSTLLSGFFKPQNRKSYENQYTTWHYHCAFGGIDWLGVLYDERASRKASH
ncbi:hypothetical protein [Moraxella lacunata]|uniref:hypothetical protein n=1 Tax=Moraxella lacunata TaxID=477 RepID=UPI003EE1E39A